MKNNQPTHIAMDSRIEVIDFDETDHSYSVYLKNGYRFDIAHLFIEYSISAIKESLKSVKPCTCEDCKNNLIHWTK